MKELAAIRRGETKKMALITDHPILFPNVCG